MKELKQIIKKINTLRNSWMYVLDKYPYRISFSVKKDVIIMYKEKMAGIYYSTHEIVELNNPLVQEFIKEYREVINY